MSFTFWHRISTFFMPPRFMTNTLLCSFIARVDCPCKISFIYQLIYLYYWVCLYAIKHIFLVDKCQCATCPIVRYEAQWDTKLSNSIEPLRQKVSQELCRAQHPIFLFKKTIATFEFEVSALLGNDWVEAMPQWQACIHCHISLLYQVIVVCNLCDWTTSIISSCVMAVHSLQLWLNDLVIYFWAA